MVSFRERTTMKTSIEEFDIKVIDPTAVIELEKRLIDHESGHVMKIVGHLMTIDIRITGKKLKNIEFQLKFIFSKRNRGNRNRRDRSGENRDRGTSGRGKKPGSTAARSWQHDDRTRTTY